MSANTKIEWATHTFNPWEGCTKVGPGCDNCYAAERNSRFAGGIAINWGTGAPRRRTSWNNWRKPLAWNANHDAFFALTGHRQRVFCASLADVFDNAVDRTWREELFALIASTPNLDWLLLTKRIGNVGNMLPVPFDFDKHFPNVWLGATICTQAEADRDIPKLLAVPAAKRFLSMEPLLGAVDLNYAFGIPSGAGRGSCPMHLAGIAPEGLLPKGHQHLNWVIVGGESGPNARPMHPDWARSLRDQCVAAGVPFLFKQWGQWRPAVWFDGPDADEDNGDAFVDLDRTDHVFLANDGRTWDTNGGKYMYPPLPLGHWCLMVKEGKKAAGRFLDNRTWDEVPI